MMTRKGLSKRIIFYEAIGFAIAIVFFWAIEFFDAPSQLAGREATPVNYAESLIESIFILILAILVITHTYRTMKRVNFLEGFLPVCAHCKRIRIEGKWIPIVDYISTHSEAEFSHSLCPDCIEEHYSEFSEDEVS